MNVTGDYQQFIQHGEYFVLSGVYTARGIFFKQRGISSYDGWVSPEEK